MEGFNVHQISKNSQTTYTCMCIITIDSQDTNQCHMSYAMLNFSSPDQKFSEHKPMSHVICNVKFFQPGLEIRREPTKP